MPEELTQAKSEKMERMLSLTSYMDGPHSVKRSHDKATTRFDLRRSQMRIVARLTRWALLALLGGLLIMSSRRVIERLSESLPDSVQVTRLAMAPLNIYDTFETVPYPLATHPRTPTIEEARQIVTFADYLSTRLGSHFSFPPTKSQRQAGRQSTHLWLTTATNSSVRVSTPHLVSFVQQTSRESRLAYAPDLFADRGAVRRDNGTSSRVTKVATTKMMTDEEAFLTALPSKSDLTARRELVVLCRDQGCLEYCRQRPDWFCYGGFIDVEDDGVSLVGEERMKLRATIEALESGRRVFSVDS
jgi:hypothetical protein